MVPKDEALPYEDLGGGKLRVDFGAEAVTYLESFNGRFRDECLNENQLRSLAHARVIIEDWRSITTVSDPTNRSITHARGVRPRARN